MPKTETIGTETTINAIDVYDTEPRFMIKSASQVKSIDHHGSMISAVGYFNTIGKKL